MESVDDRATKRRRLHERTPQGPNITSPDQLHEILQFRQFTAPESKVGILQFKDFLSSIIKNEDSHIQSKQLIVLRQYCNQQASSSKDQIDFPDILSTWSYASENNNESVLSAVPAALAQFFKTVSRYLEFRDFGLSLCHSLLKRDQVHLLERGLSAPRTKSHLISPCLRLLTEIVSFDGGALANNVWARRDALFKRFDSLLEMHAKDSENKSRRQPTVRRMALRLLLAILKFSDSSAKGELLTQGKTLHASLRGMLDDGSDILVEVLDSLDKCVVEDSSIPKQTKSRFLNVGNLQSIASLYGYEPDLDDDPDTNRVRDAAHKLLTKICTTKKGVLLPQNDWYPAGIHDGDLEAQNSDYIDLGLESPAYFDDYSNSVPVKNGILSTFVQTLRPEADSLQASLVLQIFEAAPELVADYFTKKCKFTHPPKDDLAWRSQFAFYFSIIQLPLPTLVFKENKAMILPPPLTIAIESILPRPFDHNTTSKLFNLADEIMVISGARLIAVSLEKLKSVLDVFTSKSSDQYLWNQAAARLLDLYLQRAPQLKDVLLALQRTSSDNSSIRSILLDCLAMYYKVLPEATSGSKFDISLIMTETLQQATSSAINKEARDILLEQLISCVTIADSSTNTKWLHKPDLETLSPLGLLIKASVSDESSEQLSSLQLVAMDVLQNRGVICATTASFNAFLQSLQPSKKFILAHNTLLFLDNCIQRTTARPVKYLDQIESIQSLVSDKKSLSLLSCCIAEQWEFAVKNHGSDRDTLKNISVWITRYSAGLDTAGENFRVLMQLQEEMLNKSTGKIRTDFEKAIEKSKRKSVVLSADSITNSDQPRATGALADDRSPGRKFISLEDLYGGLPLDTLSLEGLDRWDENTDMETSVQSGRVGKLLLRISSSEDEIRRQTFQIIQRLACVIDESTYSEKAQLYLVVGEVCETVRIHGLDTPLPSMVAELAMRVVQTLADPSHPMYSKINKFLLRSPSWEIKRLIPYFIDKILLQEPESEEYPAWSDEVEWLLEWLHDGLKRAADMDLYRRNGVLERVLVLYGKPRLPQVLKRSILKLLWRACNVGGADTLWTRFGVYDWLEAIKHTDKENSELMEGLQTTMEKQSTTTDIEKWKSLRPVVRSKQGI